MTLDELYGCAEAWLAGVNDGVNVDAAESALSKLHRVQYLGSMTLGEPTETVGISYPPGTLCMRGCGKQEKKRAKLMGAPQTKKRILSAESRTLMRGLLTWLHDDAEWISPTDYDFVDGYVSTRSSPTCDAFFTELAYQAVKRSTSDYMANALTLNGQPLYVVDSIGVCHYVFSIGICGYGGQGITLEHKQSTLLCWEHGQTLDPEYLKEYCERSAKHNCWELRGPTRRPKGSSRVGPRRGTALLRRAKGPERIRRTLLLITLSPLIPALLTFLMIARACITAGPRWGEPSLHRYCCCVELVMPPRLQHPVQHWLLLAMA